MIRAKNYEAMSKFVKVMPRILWTLFPETVNILQQTAISIELTLTLLL